MRRSKVVKDSRAQFIRRKRAAIGVLANFKHNGLEDREALDRTQEAFSLDTNVKSDAKIIKTLRGFLVGD